MHRVVIFTSNASWAVPATLIRATLDAASSRENLELVAVCVPERENYACTLYRDLMFRARHGMRCFFDRTRKAGQTIPLPINLNRWARHSQVHVLVPPGGDINHPDFIARLRNEVRPTIALSFYCLRKFSPELLGVFDDAVNYHNGLLPKYRGLRATEWSVYHGEPESGFTFHRMTAAFDEGPILVQGAIRIGAGQGTLALELAKAAAAATEISRVLDMLLAKDPGRAQTGESGYFSMARYAAMTRVPDPSTLSSVELAKRLQAFGSLRIRISDTWHWVTKIRPIPDRPSRDRRTSFRTSDGVTINIVLFGHLPYSLYRVRRWVGRRLRRHIG